MRRLFILPALLVVTALAVWTANAQPQSDQKVGPPGPPHGAGTARSTGPGGPRVLGPRFEEQLDRDIAWLREKGLNRYADELTKLRNSEDPEKRMPLWRAHRRIDQLIDWSKNRPEETKRAIEEIKLDAAVVDQAKECRQAEGTKRQELSAKLRQLAEKQFDARLQTQRAMIDSIEQRLKQLRDNLAKQEHMRDLLIDQRCKDLTDPSRPTPEIQLAPAPPEPEHKTGE
jgi:hypothetical protein